MPTNGTQLNIMIDAEKRDAFKIKVRGQGKTVNEVINELIDNYLAIDDDKPNPSNPSNLEEKINQVIEDRLGNFPNLDNFDKGLDSLVESKLKQAIADSITPIFDRLNRLENYQVIQDNPSDLSEETPKSEPEEITRQSLAPILDEPENEPLNDSTPENDVLSIEEKLDDLLSKLEGQSSEVTENNTRNEGLNSAQLANLLGVDSYNISKWEKLRNNGQTELKGKNGQKYQEFLKWEKKGDRWFKRAI